MGDKPDKPSKDVKQTPPGTSSAASVSSLGRNDESSDRPKKARRTFLTQNACTRCRLKKSKCDGRRPVCGRCDKHHAECVYDVAQEGITRMQNLQQQIEGLKDENMKLRNFVLALQRGSDQDATTLLARWRLGETIEGLLALVGFCFDRVRSSSYVATQLHPDLRLRPTPLMQIRIQNDPAPSDIQQSPYLDSWPASPLQDGDESAWTSWSTRCGPGGRDMSQSSESRTDPRLTMGIPPPNPTMDMSDGYATAMPDGFSGSGQNIPFSSIQWQNALSQDDQDDLSPPGMNISSGPYYVDPAQPGIQTGQHSERQKGRMQPNSPQDRRFSQ